MRWLRLRWSWRVYHRLANAERWPAVLDCLQRMRPLAPDDADLLAFLGEALYRVGRYQEAYDLLVARRERLAAAGEEDEYAVPAEGYIGRAAYHVGRMDEARERIGHAVAEDSPMSDDRYFQGLFAFHDGDPSAARAQWREVEAEEPAFYYKRLQELFDAALAREGIAPERARSRLGLRRRLALRWRWWVYNRLANAERHPQVLACLQGMRPLAPDDETLTAFLGEALYMVGRYQEAHDLLVDRRERMALAGEQDPFAAPAAGYIGRAAYHLGQMGEARRQLAYAVGEDSPMPEDRYFQGLFAVHSGDRAAGEALWDEVEAEEPAFYHKRLQTLFDAALAREAAG